MYAAGIEVTMIASTNVELWTHEDNPSGMVKQWTHEDNRKCREQEVYTRRQRERQGQELDTRRLLQVPRTRMVHTKTSPGNRSPHDARSIYASAPMIAPPLGRVAAYRSRSHWLHTGRYVDFTGHDL